MQWSTNPCAFSQKVVLFFVSFTLQLVVCLQLNRTCDGVCIYRYVICLRRIGYFCWLVDYFGTRPINWKLQRRHGVLVSSDEVCQSNQQQYARASQRWSRWQVLAYIFIHSLHISHTHLSYNRSTCRFCDSLPLGGALCFCLKQGGGTQTNLFVYQIYAGLKLILPIALSPALSNHIGRGGPEDAVLGERWQHKCNQANWLCAFTI